MCRATKATDRTPVNMLKPYSYGVVRGIQRKIGGLYNQILVTHDLGGSILLINGVPRRVKGNRLPFDKNGESKPQGLEQPMRNAVLGKQTIKDHQAPCPNNVSISRVSRAIELIVARSFAVNEHHYSKYGGKASKKNSGEPQTTFLSYALWLKLSFIVKPHNYSFIIITRTL